MTGMLYHPLYFNFRGILFIHQQFRIHRDVAYPRIVGDQIL